MDWKSIIVTALISGLVTVATGMFLFWWKAEEPELTYNSIQSIPFDDVGNKLFIQQVEIQNSGAKPAENVMFIAKFDDGAIQKAKIDISDAITHKKTITDQSVQLEVSSLNPGEQASVSVLYRSTEKRSDGAEISLRAKGVTGAPIGSDTQDRKEPIFIALVAAYAGMFAFGLSTKRGRRMLPLLARGMFAGGFAVASQKEQIASALSLYGYPDKAKEYLQSGGGRKYWVEADLLAAEAVDGQERLKRDTIEILHRIGEVPNIAQGSEAIVKYNIARIYKTLNGGGTKAEEYLGLARGLDAREVDRRQALDPVFLEGEENLTIRST